MLTHGALNRGDVVAQRYQVATRSGETSLWIGYHGFDKNNQTSTEPTSVLEPDVLIKVVRPGLLHDDAARSHLQRELQRVKGLPHPRMQRLIDVQRLDELHTVALIEPILSQSMPLRRMITIRNNVCFQLTEVRQIGAQLASALSYLHRQMMCHGDLRLDSVILRPDGAKLCDSGLGAALPRDLYLDAVQKTGESDLLAPEVRTGKQPDPSSDVFGLASLYRYLISLGQNPAWEAFLNENPAMAAVLIRGMAEDPSARYPSTEALLADVEAVALTGAPIRKHLVQTPRAMAVAAGRRPTLVKSMLMSLGSLPPKSSDVAWHSASLDSIESDRRESWLGVDAPQHMKVGETKMVRAMAIRELLQKLLVDEALTQENRQLHAARLAPIVRMELVPVDPDDFSVRALSSVEQQVSQDELTVWEWLITARQPGPEKMLLLTVTHRSDVEGTLSGKSLPARRLKVQVVLHADELASLVAPVAASAIPALSEIAAPGLSLPSHLEIPTTPDFHGATSSSPLTSRIPRWLLGTLFVGLVIAARFPLRTLIAPPRSVEEQQPSRGALAGAAFADLSQQSMRAFTPLSPIAKVSVPIPEGKNYAVLFATMRYDDPSWRQLKTPKSDAAGVAADLQALYGFDVETLEDRRADEIRQKIRELAQRKYDPGDQLFLMFSGHGDKDEILKKGWIIARDSKHDDRQSAYPYSELREDIDNIPCPHILLVLDVCFGGSFDPSIRESLVRGSGYHEAATDEFLQRKRQYRSRLYISSVDQKTSAPDGEGHSPFAWKLLEALRGGGGADGILTWNELVVHLEKLNPEPRGGIFPKSLNSDPGGDFLFVMKKPR